LGASGLDPNAAAICLMPENVESFDLLMAVTSLRPSRL
jgi:hypothetical protein